MIVRLDMKHMLDITFIIHDILLSETDFMHTIETDFTINCKITVKESVTLKPHPRAYI